MPEGPGQGGFEPPGSPYDPPPPAGVQPAPADPRPPLGYPGGSAAAGPGGGSAKGFLPSLFEFSFSSFVATRVVKVLYVLIVFVAVYRVLLEVMVVVFRMAEDLAEIRRRGGSGI